MWLVSDLHRSNLRNKQPLDISWTGGNEERWTDKSFLRVRQIWKEKIRYFWNCKHVLLYFSFGTRSPPKHCSDICNLLWMLFYEYAQFVGFAVFVSYLGTIQPKHLKQTNLYSGTSSSYVSTSLKYIWSFCVLVVRKIKKLLKKIIKIKTSTN